MSTDFDAVCDVCRVSSHIGQVMAGRPSFGYGSKDFVGQAAAARFVFEHAACGRGARVILSDSSENRDSDDYARQESPQHPVAPTSSG